MSLKNRCLEYFYYFSNKDIDNVMHMCDGSVKLKDWDIDVKGLKKVNKSIMDIFNNVDTIKVVPLSLIQEDNIVCCEINILVNNNEKLDVIDVITFNEYGLIESIKAYKC